MHQFPLVKYAKHCKSGDKGLHRLEQENYADLIENSLPAPLFHSKFQRYRGWPLFFSKWSPLQSFPGE